MYYLPVRAGRPSVTAGWVAAQRLRLDHERPVCGDGDVEAEQRLYSGFGPILRLAALRPTGMAARTAFFDGETMRAIHGGVEQIVILGAGYDGRAVRFRHGAVRWIEVDFPSTQADKRRRLDALGVTLDHLRFAPADLMVDDVDSALGSAGHDPLKPTLFICEGLFAYLDPDAGSSLCEKLRRRGSAGSVLAANFLVAPPTSISGRALRGTVDRVLSALGERRRNQFRPGDAERMLSEANWSIVRRTASRPARTDAGTYMLGLAAEPGGRGSTPTDLGTA